MTKRWKVLVLAIVTMAATAAPAREVWRFHGIAMLDECGFGARFPTTVWLDNDGGGVMGRGRIAGRCTEERDGGWTFETDPWCQDGCCVVARVATMDMRRRTTALLDLIVRCDNDTIACLSTYLGKAHRRR